jgi:transcriptional regulator with XRE-family HTH domain
MAAPVSERPSRALAGRLRGLRGEAGLSQAELARRLGISQAAVSNWESGARQPSLDDLYLLAAELDVEVFDLLPRRPGPPLRATLRGVAEKLERSSLATALEQFVDYAETIDRPARQISIRSDAPDQAAAELLQELAITAPPVKVRAAAAACGVLVIEWTFDESLSGLVVDTPEGAVIGVNETQTVTRKRFTVGHELGHVLLRHLQTFHVDLGDSQEDGDPPDYNWRHERAANEFSAALLMPPTLVHDAFAATASVRGLAAMFEVSELAMGFRLDNLGLR